MFVNLSTYDCILATCVLWNSRCIDVALFDGGDQVEGLRRIHAAQQYGGNGNVRKWVGKRPLVAWIELWEFPCDVNSSACGEPVHFQKSECYHELSSPRCADKKLIKEVFNLENPFIFPLLEWRSVYFGAVRNNKGLQDSVEAEANLGVTVSV